ncbi:MULTISPECIES: AsmA-like C-terminal region-containing protein [Hydrogenophaga]|uniref:Uncharacterized protein n=1 Tax=Hydrogenophaga intermedia TaxID=65786 RepID=A0A1L1PE14_HYDIT|nr:MULTISPECIES: AsmA-like C-terminal region-containing protein [Hydrogenophaga]AOS80029.1 hypothetical protein Q5W_14155 [Hydrogenophaga sp. PBC]TMU75367.1 hypothetical protein FGJ01_09530 [Hydrogenophaga intermedia]CDN88302.1 Putative uncharacterized protein precursor [Hydrogenophaga intermedia]
MRTRARRWTAIVTAALLVLWAGAWLALRAFMPSDDELARRLEALFEARTGQALVIGQLHWRLLGTPVVEVMDAHTRQDEPIRVRRIALHPQLLPLLRRQLVIDRLEVAGAQVPRDALRALRGSAPVDDGNVVLRRLVFTDLTYTSYAGIPVAYSGEIRFDDDRLPRRVQIHRPGVEPPVALDATRDGRTDNGAHIYRLELQAAGGTASGQAQLITTDDGHLRLTGQLAPRQVEVQTLLDAFHRRSFISGRASGTTELRAEGETWGALARSLHTRSELTVDGGKILRIDVDKAVKSLGDDRAGETPLDSLSGVVETQNTEHGMKTEFSDVKAVAGSYSATGHATIYRKRLAAQGRLDIAGGAVGVPFAASGPTRQPEFKIAKGTIAGAAIGTVLLPGIGTAIGAQIGGAISGPPDIEKDKEKEPSQPRRPPR